MVTQARKTKVSERHLWWFTLFWGWEFHLEKWLKLLAFNHNKSFRREWLAQPGRGLRVKVNLLTFKDEKTKDVVTYHSWQWDIAIFCHSGWDDQHFLPHIISSLQGFSGDLARNPGTNATLNDVLQILDEHYGMVMTFDTLSKELYSLKLEAGENVAKLGVWLLQQIQILESEYPGWISQEHIEKMKWDHFYEGLNPKYWWMLTHKVDGEHPTRYSNLLLAAQKLERWAEARDPLLLKATPMGGLNVTHSQTSGNLFPPWKLKGSHAFTARSATIDIAELQKTQAWRQRSQKRSSLQKERTQKPWVES